MFVGVLISALPIFLLIFFYKCIDQYAYKKKGITSGAIMWLFSNLIVVLLAHVIFASLEGVIFQYDPGVSIVAPIVLVPIFTVAALLIMYLYERKAVKDASNSLILTKSFGVNIGLSMIFNAAYGALINWNVFPVQFEILSEAKPTPEQEMKDTVLWIGVIALIIITILIKIISQLMINKSGKKTLEIE